MSLSHKPSLWFWIASVLLLAWNLIGVMVYVQEATMSAPDLQAMAPAERMLLQSRPVWATAAFAIGVFGGAAGCLLLLLRSRIALPVLALSFIGLAVQIAHAFLMADTYAIYGPSGFVVPTVVLAVSAFAMWYARRARKRGWLR